MTDEQHSADGLSETRAPLREGDVLWWPDEQRQKASRLRAYLDWLTDEAGLAFAGYDDLWRWSVTEPGDFWRSLWDYFEVRSHTPPRTALESRAMPGARWFPGATLSYAEHALAFAGSKPAIVACDEEGGRVVLSRDELREKVARARAGLRRLGVGRGDRVVAFLPNVPETVVAFLATASLGAIWSSCSPEFGVASVLDRFRQIEPKVLLAVDGYRYGGKSFNRAREVESIAQGLPTLEATVILSRRGERRIAVGRTLSFDELLQHHEPLTFEVVPFDHPLWVLYSSGTTGLPKAIVHGHGGILLEHLKALSFHCDLGESDRFFWFSTTGWMMWNFLVGGLLLGSTIVLYDGSPGHPNLEALWRLAERERLSYFGTSAPFLLACQKAGIEPSRFDLEALRSVGSTGAPLPVGGFEWVYRHVKEDVLLGSVSGGTDVCTAFALSCPLLPVRAGALQCAGLGCKVEAFDAGGRPVIGQVGELVLTEPMPSMPLYFWGDVNDERYRSSYFADYPGVWRHGDWVKIEADGSLVISGRSDATLNRGGVRMGTSEFYAVVERIGAVADSLVVDTSEPGGAEGTLWLFLVLREGETLTESLCQEVRNALRSELSPRHVPDRIVSVRAVPRTLSGKKCEVPVKRILSGMDPEAAVSRDTLVDSTAVDEYVALAGQGKTDAAGSTRPLG